MDNSIWGNRPLPGSEPVFEQIGPLRIWMRSNKDELQMTHEYIEEWENPTEDAKLPEDELWQRWTLKRGAKELQLQPILPDLPVVVKPESVFRILPDVRTSIYVRVPIWLRATLGGTTIFELPAMRLSKTWFGNFYNGEVCYWIVSSARKEVIAQTTPVFLAISPIDIVNRSSQVLQMDKICHRVRKLSLYHNGDELWSNKATVSYRGDGLISEIGFSRKPPSQAGSNTALTRARDVPQKGFTAKTFSTLFEMTRLDLFNR